MLPILFKIGPFTVHTYGVAMALAFLAGLLLIHHEAKRKGFNPEIAYDVVLFAMLGGIIGARLIYVAYYWRDFAANPAQVFAIWTGGLIFYGGLIGGVLAVLAVIKFRKLSVGKVADMAAPAMAIGSAIGRIGCFANGCCYGKETSSFLGVTYTNELASARPLGVSLYPTQLFEVAYNLLILGILWWARPKLKSDGLLFWMYVTLYGFFRFIIEFFRADPVFYFGMSGSQLFSLAMLVVGLSIIFGYYFRSNQFEVKRADK